MSHARMIVFKLCPFDLIFPIILVRAITQLSLGISSCNFIGMCLMSGRHVGYNNSCFLHDQHQVRKIWEPYWEGIQTSMDIKSAC